jgi:hypothetical protein
MKFKRVENFKVENNEKFYTSYKISFDGVYADSFIDKERFVHIEIPLSLLHVEYKEETKNFVVNIQPLISDNGTVIVSDTSYNNDFKKEICSVIKDAIIRQKLFCIE